MAKFNPDPPGRPTFRPQFPIRSSDLRHIGDSASSALRAADHGGHADQGASTGTQLDTSTDLPGFHARLTAPPIVTDPPNPFYNFAEVHDDGTGHGWVTDDGCWRGKFLSDQVTYNAYPISGNTSIPVPGPPVNVEANQTGYGIYYIITSTWKRDSDEVQLQSGESIEVSCSGLATLTWYPPAPVTGYTLQSFSIWKGTPSLPSASPQYDQLIGVVNYTTDGQYTFIDGGIVLALKSPIPGGDAGPIVWMQPLATWDYFKFLDIVGGGAAPAVTNWALLEIQGKTPQTLPEVGTGLGPISYPAASVVGKDQGQYVWATMDSVNAPSGIQYSTPTDGGLYMGFFSGTTTVPPPQVAPPPPSPGSPPPPPSTTSYDIFQLLWAIPFNYISTLDNSGNATGSYSVLAAEPSFIVDSLNIYFGPPNELSSTAPPLNPVASTTDTVNLFIQFGGGPYQGATGTDGMGNQFISGLCVNVGAGQGGGSGGGGGGPAGPIDGGSYW